MDINLLSLEAAQKTKEHTNMTIDELKSIILHEFVHICQQESEKEHIKEDIVWFWEAYQNYNQQKETEQIFLDASKKIDEIEKNLDNNEDTNKQFSEIKKTLTWRILN